MTFKEDRDLCTSWGIIYRACTLEEDQNNDDMVCSMKLDQQTMASVCQDGNQRPNPSDDPRNQQPPVIMPSQVYQQCGIQTIQGGLQTTSQTAELTDIVIEPLIVESDENRDELSASDENPQQVQEDTDPEPNLCDIDRGSAIRLSGRLLRLMGDDLHNKYQQPNNLQASPPEITYV